MRILIADTDETLLELMQSYLQKRGHDIQISSRGLECITRLRGSIPDLIVLSHELLWGGCHGILAELQDDPQLSGIPVILIADSRTDFDALSGTNVVGWLQKPFQLSCLLQEIESAFRSSKKVCGENLAALNECRTDSTLAFI